MSPNNLEFKYIYNVNTFLSNYISKYNEKSDKKITGYQSISLCTTNNTYSVLQIQPKSQLVVDLDKGLYSCEPDYENRLWSFIEKSFETNYDLVLTPEYSVSLDIVKRLIASKERMEAGTLYCLCCYGTPYKCFEEFINECSVSTNICKASWNNIQTKGKIVCALFYVTKIKFQTEDDEDFYEVFVFPQLKIHPMKDTGMDFESAALSCGNKVFYFGKDNEIGFLSIICADVFKSDLIFELKGLLETKKVFIFHPQLNSKPHNTYFQQMRSTLISYSQRGYLKILTLNWAEGTSFIIDGKEQTAIINSWSAIYEKYNEHYFEDYIKVFNKNAKYGLNIAHDHHVVACYFSSKDHIIEMNMSRITDSSTPEDVQYTLILSIIKCYVYDEDSKQYVNGNKSLCKNMVNPFFINTQEFSYMLDCDNCCNKNKVECSLSIINQFVSSIYNRNTTKEYEIINDGNVTSVSAEHYSSPHPKEKLMICKRIYNKLLNKEVTLKFKSLPPVFKFQYYKEGENIYNVKYLTEVFKNENCRVIYLKYAQKAEAEKLFRKLYNANNDIAENLIIYYEDELGVHIYPDSTSVDITSPQIMANNASILGGKQ